MSDSLGPQASLSITNSWSLLKPMSVESVMPSKPLILCHPLLSHLQSFSKSGSFLMSHFFTSGSQSIGGSASASILPMNIQDWFPLGLTDLISFLPKGLSSTTVGRHQFFSAQPFLWSPKHPNSLSVLQIRIITLLGRVFGVVGFFCLIMLNISCLSLLLKSLLMILWTFLCI